MISFCKIGCKITLFFAHSQIKCTKTAEMCTLRLFCAISQRAFTNHRRRTVVHHPCMVGADELAVKTLAGCAVDDVAIDLAVAIDHTVLSRENFILCPYCLSLLLHFS